MPGASRRAPTIHTITVCLHSRYGPHPRSFSLGEKGREAPRPEGEGVGVRVCRNSLVSPLAIHLIEQILMVQVALQIFDKDLRR